MRLFAAGTFYLSRSSSLAAEYLCDRDTIQQHRNTGVLLSTVLQLQVLERNTALYPPDPSIYDECDEVCAWLHASAHNVAWLIDYFNCLDAKCVRLFDMTPLTWDFKRVLLTYTQYFDYADTTDDWLPLAPSQARSEYALEIKKYQYRKVKPPFWFDPVIPRAKASDPEPSLLEPLDLSPLW